MVTQGGEERTHPHPEPFLSLSLLSPGIKAATRAERTSVLSFQGEGRRTPMGGLMTDIQAFGFHNLKSGAHQKYALSQPKGAAHSRTCNIMPKIPDVKHVYSNEFNNTDWDNV